MGFIQCCKLVREIITKLAWYLQSIYYIYIETIKNLYIMTADLRIEENDLKALFVHTRCAYGNMTFGNWCKECEKSYMSYFNNEELFSKRKYTYSQYVNAQIIAIT
jgi:hypothetical protein